VYHSRPSQMSPVLPSDTFQEEAAGLPRCLNKERDLYFSGGTGA
jgi:hypothetical protein